MPFAEVNGARLYYDEAGAGEAVVEHPERVWALVPVASGLSGFSFRAYDDEQVARAEAAEQAGDQAAAAGLWLEVWAPLGLDEPIRTLAHDRSPEEFSRLVLEFLDPVR